MFLKDTENSNISPQNNFRSKWLQESVWALPSAKKKKKIGDLVE